jgi:hypothetical protein
VKRLVEAVTIVVVVLGGAWLSMVLSWESALKGRHYE